MRLSNWFRSDSETTAVLKNIEILIVHEFTLFVRKAPTKNHRYSLWIITKILKWRWGFKIIVLHLNFDVISQVNCVLLWRIGGSKLLRYIRIVEVISEVNGVLLRGRCSKTNTPMWPSTLYPNIWSVFVSTKWPLWVFRIFCEFFTV